MYSRSGTQTTKKVSSIAMGVILTTGTAAGLIYYLDRTSRLQLLEFAREHKGTTLQDSTWRNCIAVALIDLYRQKSGPQIVRRLRCGVHLGRLIANPKTLFLRDSIRRSCTPEIMTVLLILSNADITILIDAIAQGGVVVLDKLYDHNKDDCENAIIQLIKQKISYTN